MRMGSQPVSVGFPENPWPGSDGITRWKASDALAPCVVGSVSGSMIFSGLGRGAVRDHLPREPMQRHPLHLRVLEPPEHVLKALEVLNRLTHLRVVEHRREHLQRVAQLLDPSAARAALPAANSRRSRCHRGRPAGAPARRWPGPGRRPTTRRRPRSAPSRPARTTPPPSRRAAAAAETRDIELLVLRHEVAILRRTNDAAPLLLKAAKRLEPLHLDLARETYLSAWMAALFAGRLAGAGDLLEVCRAVRALRPSRRSADGRSGAGRPGADRDGRAGGGGAGVEAGGQDLRRRGHPRGGRVALGLAGPGGGQRPVGRRRMADAARPAGPARP